MPAELVRGQNHPLPCSRLEVRIAAGGPVVAAATLSDEEGRLCDSGWVAHPARPGMPGVEVPRQAAMDHRLAVDLDALPDGAHRVSVLLALVGDGRGPAGFGALAPTFLVLDSAGGEEIAGYALTGLGKESAVVAVELYRRQAGWKVRAVGQGYEGGLAALLADQGLPCARELADTVEEAVAAGAGGSVALPPPRADGGGIDYRHPARQRPPKSAESAPGEPGPAEVTVTAAPLTAAPLTDVPLNVAGGEARVPEPAGPPMPVAGDANGWSMDERLYNQVWGMFEDLARTVAAYRSAVEFAGSRMERELEAALADPRTRMSTAADSARAAAKARQVSLVERARAVLESDLAQLTAESAVVEPALPPAYARWDNPVWHAYTVPEEVTMAMRLGDLSLPEGAGLRVPMLVRLPLERGIWLDSGGEKGLGGYALIDPAELRRLAAETAAAIAARLVAVHPAGGFALHAIDPMGSAGDAFAPLLETGALLDPPAAGSAGIGELLGRLAQRVDLVQMALRGGAIDALPPIVDAAGQLLLINDFPHGFDDHAINQLRYLVDEGPSVGVSVLLVADRADTQAYGPLLDPLWRALLRLTPVPDDHLADPWVGHRWTYEPPLAPQDCGVVPQVLRDVAAARRSCAEGERS